MSVKQISDAQWHLQERIQSKTFAMIGQSIEPDRETHLLANVMRDQKRSLREIGESLLWHLKHRTKGICARI